MLVGKWKRREEFLVGFRVWGFGNMSPQKPNITTLSLIQC